MACVAFRAKKTLLFLLCLLLILLLSGCSRDSAGTPSSENVTSGLDGLLLVELTDEESMLFYHVTTPGVYVLAVTEGSEAALAGVSSGDRVTHLGGQAVETSSQVTAIMETLPEGEIFQMILEDANSGGTYEVSLTGC